MNPTRAIKASFLHSSYKYANINIQIRGSSLLQPDCTSDRSVISSNNYFNHMTLNVHTCLLTVTLAIEETTQKHQNQIQQAQSCV